MVAVIGVILFGLVAGAIGRLVVPGRQRMGCIATVLCGIGGALVGGLVGRLLFGSGYTPGLIMSALGAALLIFLIYGRR